ncbi:MAG: ribosomal-processing cysteine protease Prp [Epulopiscium sp.]|mgnify:CR=1 FL=1|nr:ribosomal-processing cysteine protease Prp [Candidatus Epulonipiscium sp.]
MIRITVFRRKKNKICGFRVAGHADYGPYGTDIVCSAVTALVFNAINSIETFTLEPIEYEVQSEGGFIQCQFLNAYQSDMGSEAKLLVESMLLGISQIQEDYGTEYIQIVDEEVE